MGLLGCRPRMGSNVVNYMGRCWATFIGVGTGTVSHVRMYIFKWVFLCVSGWLSLYKDMNTKGSSGKGFEFPDNYPCFRGRLLTQRQLKLSGNWIKRGFRRLLRCRLSM